MKKIYVATKARGFLMSLFDSKYENIEFIYENNKLYETNSKFKIILSKLVKSKMADHLGIIQRIEDKNNSYNYTFSYNRFLKTKKDYVIYLENPLALVHYSTNRNNTFMSKVKLNKYFNDTNLKAIICLSKACYETVNNFYEIPNRIKVIQIYPLVLINALTSQESIIAKCHKKDIECLYISSNFNLKGGKDIIATFNELKNLNINNIKLNIITQVNSVDINMKKQIEANENITISDFKFNKEKLNKIYNDSCILLNPTRQDSFSLVVLEAMKSGNAIISTDLYAIPEMVIDNYNGYLTNPKYRFFNYNNMPNNSVWNNRKNTIYSDYTDYKIVDFLLEKIMFLNNNRDELERLAINSYNRSNNGELNEEFIKEKWSKLF